MMTIIFDYFLPWKHSTEVKIEEKYLQQSSDEKKPFPYKRDKLKFINKLH